MRLKRLEILGFKSFADKTEIEFQPGVTGVVGPNGCGKSNISDALRWVLGEQSMRALRGVKLDDVIFAGSDARKPLGVAEVELVLDNSDGQLPMEFNEISIARRLYRSGESEFLINKAYVRLRDIQELFLDTGLGKEAYSVIGQGKIDAILSAKAEERRAIFEEAAGVVKYKLRKAAAMRRLEETEANLLRALDLLTELEGQLGPLQAQAALAEQCNKLQSELAYLDINLCGHELAELEEAGGRAQEGLVKAQARDGELEREEAVLEAGLEEARLAGTAREEQIAQGQQAVYNLGNRLEQERGKLELVREKIRAQEERAQASAAHKQETETRLAAVLARQAEQAQSLADVGQSRSEIAMALEESENGITTRDNEVQDLLRREEEFKAEIIEDMNRVAGTRNNLQAAEMEGEYLARARQELKAKAEALAQETAAAAERLREAEAEAQKVAAADAEAAAEEKRLAESKRSLQSSLAGLETKNVDWRERIKGLESRLNLLEEMERTYQGYFPGVRSVLVEAKGEAFARGIRGLIAELISVKPGYEIALETALGSALQNVVIEEEAQAQAAIAFLKKTGRGRATFLPLNLVKGSRASLPGLAEAMQACEAHLAVDLLEFSPEYRGVVEHLLGATLITPTLAQAVSLAKRINKSLRIVTKEGEIISVGGAMTGGALDGRKVQILGRKREIEELKREKDTALSFLAKGVAEAERAKSELNRTENAVVELANRRRELTHALAAAGKTTENLQAGYVRLQEETQLIQFQLAESDEKGTALTARGETLRLELAAAEAALAGHRQELADLGQEIKRSQSEKDAAIQALSDFRVALATKTEEEKKHREVLAETETQVLALKREAAADERDLREIAAALAGLREEEARTETGIRDTAKAGEEAEAALAALVAAQKEAQGEGKKTEQRLRALRKERQALAEQARRFEVSLGEWRVRMENHREHLLQEYGLGWEERMEQAWEMPHEEASARIETLRAEIKALGLVNPGAIAEYANLRNRYEFLRGQSDDLASAKESLQRIIAEVEKTISERFLATFQEVREVFINLFRELFAGGKADLLLIDPDNPLDSGIEVVAQPPGKRLQSLSLLSGGERAMTAIALLFSILKIKPSPFCILDEIDATLDEANVARFADLLARFSQEMQFIVVTHRRGTMETADALYGVTMEEMGVSKLISLQLREKAG